MSVGRLGTAARDHTTLTLTPEGALVRPEVSRADGRGMTCGSANANCAECSAPATTNSSRAVASPNRSFSVLEFPPREVTDRVLKLRGQGWPFAHVAYCLNGDGIPTARGGAKWYASSDRRRSSLAIGRMPLAVRLHETAGPQAGPEQGRRRCVDVSARLPIFGNWVPWAEAEVLPESLNPLVPSADSFFGPALLVLLEIWLRDRWFGSRWVLDRGVEPYSRERLSRRFLKGSEQFYLRALL